MGCRPCFQARRRLAPARPDPGPPRGPTPPGNEAAPSASGPIPMGAGIAPGTIGLPRPDFLWQRPGRLRRATAHQAQRNLLDHLPGNIHPGRAGRQPRPCRCRLRPVRRERPHRGHGCHPGRQRPCLHRRRTELVRHRNGRRTGPGDRRCGRKRQQTTALGVHNHRSPALRRRRGDFPPGRPVVRRTERAVPPHRHILAMAPAPLPSEDESTNA